MPKTHADGTVTDASAPVVVPPATEEVAPEPVEPEAKPAPTRKPGRKKA